MSYDPIGAFKAPSNHDNLKAAGFVGLLAISGPVGWIVLAHLIGGGLKAQAAEKNLKKYGFVPADPKKWDAMSWEELEKTYKEMRTTPPAGLIEQRKAR